MGFYTNIVQGFVVGLDWHWMLGVLLDLSRRDIRKNNFGHDIRIIFREGMILQKGKV